MNTTHLPATGTKKTWQAPTVTEIKKSLILGGQFQGNDGNNNATPGSAGPQGGALAT